MHESHHYPDHHHILNEAIFVSDDETLRRSIQKRLQDDEERVQRAYLRFQSERDWKQP